MNLPRFFERPLSKISPLDSSKLDQAASMDAKKTKLNGVL